MIRVKSAFITSFIPTEIIMAQYVCLECGWIYDESVGDPDRGYPAGTKWEDLPDDFKCAECDTKKSDTHMWQRLD